MHFFQMAFQKEKEKIESSVQAYSTQKLNALSTRGDASVYNHLMLCYVSLMFTINQISNE